MNNGKIKILTLSDHPLSLSGVGTQTKYICEALLKTGKYQIISLGGAIKHLDYRPVQIQEYGNDWTMIPIDGYGSPEMIRSAIRTHRIDILWFMTDPRFWGWLWQIENEIRAVCPMVYYHVWDNYPYPTFNKVLYESTDVIVTISKVTSDIVRTVAPNVEEHYLPHSVNTDIFKKLPDDIVRKTKEEHFKGFGDKFFLFWNNRNAKRKLSGALIWWFKEFLDEVGYDKAALLMHTDPKDENGQDLVAICQELKLKPGENILISQMKIPPEQLATIYNIADLTFNCGTAEGFGLSTMESLACETPILVNMTGGLQEQVCSPDKTEWYGIGIEPASRTVIGSQPIPWVMEDTICKKDFIDALKKMMAYSKAERAEMGQKGREHLLKNYNYKNFNSRWDEILSKVYKERGSWDQRKMFKPYELRTV